MSKGIQYGSVGGYGGSEIIGDEIIGMIGADEEVLRDLLQGADAIGAHGKGHPNRSKEVIEPGSFLWRREFIGMTATAVTLAGAQATVTVQPQRKFKTKRVVVPSTIAAFFAFSDLKVGQNSQAAAIGNTPCQAFVENAVSCYVDFDTADVGNLISMIVLNTDVAQHTFTAVLFGIALRPQY